jgi:hypothetical protein
VVVLAWGFSYYLRRVSGFRIVLLVKLLRQYGFSFLVAVRRIS